MLLEGSSNFCSVCGEEDSWNLRCLIGLQLRKVFKERLTVIAGCSWEVERANQIYRVDFEVMREITEWGCCQHQSEMI